MPTHFSMKPMRRPTELCLDIVHRIAPKSIDDAKKKEEEFSQQNVNIKPFSDEFTMTPTINDDDDAGLAQNLNRTGIHSAIRPFGRVREVARGLC